MKRTININDDNNINEDNNNTILKDCIRYVNISHGVMLYNYAVISIKYRNTCAIQNINRVDYLFKSHSKNILKCCNYDDRYWLYL